MKIEINSASEAIATLEMNAETLSPHAIKMILADFPSVYKKAIGIYAKNLEGNEDRIIAIMESMPKRDLLELAGSLDAKILSIAAKWHPENAIDIIQARRDAKGYDSKFVANIAQAITESSKSQAYIDRIAWKMANAYPDDAHAVAEFHPHMRFEIARIAPLSVVKIAKKFPGDSLTLARCFPRQAKNIAEALPNKKEEIENYFRQE